MDAAGAAACHSATLPDVQQRLLSPTFVGLAVANFCNSMIFYLLVPTMAGYATERFGAGPAAAGTLASIFFIGALVARLVAGPLIGRFSERWLALVAAGFYLLTTAAYLVAPSLAATMVVRFLNGVGFGLVGTAIASTVLVIVPPARRGEGVGWVGVGISVAIGVGPFVALRLLARPDGMTLVFWVAVACAAAITGTLALVARRIPGRAARPHEETTRPAGKVLDGRAVPVSLMALLGGFAYSLVLAFLDSATRGTPLADAAASFFLVYAAVVVVSRPISGRVQDRFGDRAVIVPALILMILGLTAVAVAGSGLVLLTGAALLGLGWGTIPTAGQAAAVQRVPRAETGYAVATFFFLLDAGTGLGPIVLGPFVAGLGYQGSFAVGAVVSAVALALAWFVLPRGRPPISR